MTIWTSSAPSWAVFDPTSSGLRSSRRQRSKAKDAELGAKNLIASTALRARLELFSGGFNSAHRHLIKVTPYLFFCAAELPQVSLDLLDSRPALYFLECV
jgi:hypothetical protein